MADARIKRELKDLSAYRTKLEKTVDDSVRIAAMCDKFEKIQESMRVKPAAIMQITIEEIQKCGKWA